MTIWSRLIAEFWEFKDMIKQTGSQKFRNDGLKLQKRCKKRVFVLIVSLLLKFLVLRNAGQCMNLKKKLFRNESVSGICFNFERNTTNTCLNYVLNCLKKSDDKFLFKFDKR